MASSGTIVGTKVKNTAGTRSIWIQFEWQTTNKNVATNKSTISYTLKLVCETSLSFSARKSWEMSIDGTESSGTYSGGASGSGSVSNPIIKVITTGTKEIEHNSDGSKTFNISASFDIKIDWSDSGYLKTLYIPASAITLDTIPRVFVKVGGTDGSWKAGTIYVKDGPLGSGSWNQGTVKVSDGTAWKP